MWWWNHENNWNCKRCIQFYVESYSCSTHMHENKKTKYKSICVVDTFIRMWNVDNNHQKYDKLAIVWNVGISEDDENILEGKQNKWRCPNTGRRTEQLCIIPTITKRKNTYFGHMIRRNDIHRLLLEGPMKLERSRGRPITEWITNITEWTGMWYQDLVRLAQDREPWRIMTANLLKEDGTWWWWWWWWWWDHAVLHWKICSNFYSLKSHILTKC